MLEGKSKLANDVVAGEGALFQLKLEVKQETQPGTKLNQTVREEK